MAIPLLDLADTIGGLVDKLIPDADKREEVRAQVRLAVTAAGQRWNGQSITGLAAGLSLVAYLNVAGWVAPLAGAFVPIVWEVVLLLFVILALSWGLDAGSIIKLLRESRKS